MIFSLYQSAVWGLWTHKALGEADNTTAWLQPACVSVLAAIPVLSTMAATMSKHLQQSSAICFASQCRLIGMSICLGLLFLMSMLLAYRPSVTATLCSGNHCNARPPLSVGVTRSQWQHVWHSSWDSPDFMATSDSSFLLVSAVMSSSLIFNDQL